jgi:hypothetical protein
MPDETPPTETADRWVAEVDDIRGRGVDTVPFRFEGEHDGATRYAKDRFGGGVNEVLAVWTLDNWFDSYSSQQEMSPDDP